MPVAGDVGFWSVDWEKASDDGVLPSLVIVPIAADTSYWVDFRAIGAGVDISWGDGPFTATGSEPLVVALALPVETEGAGGALQVLANVAWVDPVTGAARAHHQVDPAAVGDPGTAAESWAEEALVEVSAADGLVEDGSPSQEVL